MTPNHHADVVAWLRGMLDERGDLTSAAAPLMADVLPADRPRITAALDELIGRGELAYPWRPATQAVAATAFDGLLRHNPAAEDGAVVIKHDMRFRQAALAFQFEARQRCHRWNASSGMWDRWHDPALRARWLRNIWIIKSYRRLSSRLIAAALGCNKCSAFPVTAAKFVYRRYAATSVLDPCFGWGDRMAAAYACPTVRRFHGVDPRAAARRAFDPQRSLYNERRAATGLAPVRGSFTQACAEEPGSWPDEKFDLAFTSPPFFNCEVYACEEAGELQSISRHRGMDAWFEGFLLPLLRRMSASLRQGGHLALHMTDGTKRSICKRMLRAVRERVPELRFCERLDMQVRAPPWVTSLTGSAYRAEPIWVWRRRALQDTRFEDGLRALQAFLATHGRTPGAKDRLDAGGAVGEWCRARRRQLERGKLSEDRQRRLDEAAPGWRRDAAEARDDHRHMREAHAARRAKADAAFREHLALLRELGTAGGPPRTAQEHAGVKIGRWLDNRRQDARKGRLSAEHAAELDALYPSGWLRGAGAPRPKAA